MRRGHRPRPDTALTRAARAAFWVSGGIIGWTYAAFPALLLLRGSLRPAPAREADTEPGVSIIVAAYNEEDSIARKIDNLRGLDYAGDRLQLIVASDGSEDRTEEIVRAAGPGIELLSLPRGGKAAALEAAVANASGEILVFTDANSMLAPDAIRALVRPFADGDVGGVAGDQQHGSSVEASDRGERGYWALDRRLKEAGSRAGNAVAATGALYAIRRSLFRPVPPGVNDDYFLSAGVIDQGYRLVFSADAIALEPAASNLDEEFARKVRVMSRGFQTEVRLRRLLDPRRHGFYSLQMLSQKVLRRAAGLPLAVLAVASLLAAPSGGIYRLAAAAQLAAYAFGLLGWLGHGRLPAGLRSATAVPGYFVMANTAGLVALMNLLRGRRIDRWSHGRGTR